MQTENIAFLNKDILLNGTLYKPDSTGPFPVVIVAHTSAAATRDFGVYQHLAHLLSTSGVSVFLFDRRGSGASTGNFEMASFEDLASDLLAAIHCLNLRHDIQPQKIGLWGMSQGGWIAPLTAVKTTAVAFVIAISAVGVSPAEQMNYSAEFGLQEEGFSKQAIRQMLTLRNLVDEYYRGNVTRNEVQEELDRFHNEAWFSLAYLDDTLPEDPSSDKWYYIIDFDPLPVIQKVNVPVLLLYGERDPWVPINRSINIWKANCPNDVTTYQIKDANHFMVSITHSGIRGEDGPLVKEYETLLTQWMRQQVD